MTERKNTTGPSFGPRATYRLQLQGGFTLRQALELVPYLSALGVSHIYAPPLLKARPGSTHGYDGCDPAQINPVVGAEADLEALVAALRERGMGLVLDIVPNHMGIGGPENPWWWEVLRRGRASRFADHFDIDWNSADPRLQGKVLVPVLGDEYERVLERGELKLICENAEVTVRYFEHRFPVSPESIPPQGKSPEEAVAEINSNKLTLDRFLDRQHYRLASWRQSDTALNYRRFFNVTHLAAVRVESPQVFADTHTRILDWHQRGLLDGLRIDHPDGLRDPAEYLQRLHQAAPTAWIVVEKILEPGEDLPRDWPVAGTTGYDFLNRVGGLFVDPAGERPLTEFYGEFTGEPTEYAALVREKKRLVLKELLAAEVGRLNGLMQKIAGHHGSVFTSDNLREALIELVAAFPVYRTYLQAAERVGADMPCAGPALSDLPNAVGVRAPSRLQIGDTADFKSALPLNSDDRRRIEHALGVARQRRPDLAAGLFDFLSDLLLQRRGIPAERGTDLPQRPPRPAEAPLPQHEESNLENDFVMRFQQLTGPVMAKGVEDTTFYCFNRFVALNEVGGDPSHFGPGVDEFHRACAEVQQVWPATMLSTSTHDTKRSEDVRARLSLLSEIPGPWSAAVRRWSRMNEKHRQDGFPDRNAEYLFYQTLVGAWPLPLDRALAYMEKASREARQHTTWTDPNAAYDQALRHFVTATLNDAEFTADLERFVAPLVEPGQINSLAQTLIKLTAPGVPDIYQGTELWDFSLVDPDNRRQVDFAVRRRLLEETEKLTAPQTWQRRNEGLPKLWLFQRTLAFRRRHPKLFGTDSSYESLTALGTKAAHVVAFKRGEGVVTVAPRLIIGLAGDWADTVLDLPSGNWQDELTGDPIGAGPCRLGDLFRAFPVALLSRTEKN